MKETKNQPLSAFLHGRTTLIELLLVVIFISFSVSFVAGCITFINGFDPIKGIYVGVGICSFSVLYLVCRNIGKRAIHEKFLGFLVYNKQDNMIINVPRYDFAESICRNFKSAFAENTALKLIWDSEHIDSFYRFDEDTKNHYRKEPVSAKLVREAVEYYVLENLSSHLSSFFNNDKVNEKKIHEFTRNEIPDVLLSNRFLELFSKPMIDRPLFAEHALNENNKHGKTIAMYGPNGINFREFELILPLKSKIKRLKENQIEIKTSRFSIILSVEFDGMNTSLPRGFLKHYLSLVHALDYKVYKVCLSINIKFNYWSLLSLKGWDYYKWIDSFLKVLENDISKDKFFENINWESVFTIIQCSEKRNEALSESTLVEED